ncbi:MAG: hypothetical protein U9N82_06535 [Thermodesulfobacteriota bacterium]|nr:hypothetical protein [Thermodesulfobacteriota bacterium]
MERNRRRKNEKKFGVWEDLANGGRIYSYEVQGRNGWRARYVKEVDASEFTLRFYQEIYDNSAQLVEVHEKFPVDKGHERIGGGEQL